MLQHILSVQLTADLLCTAATPIPLLSSHTYPTAQHLQSSTLLTRWPWQLAPAGDTYSLIPVNDWRTFRPDKEYRTLNSDEAEAQVQHNPPVVTIVWFTLPLCVPLS